MSKKQVMKEIFEEKVNKDKIYQNVLLKVEEETRTNRIINRKIVYGILSSCAMLIIGVAIVMSNKIGIDGNQNELNKKYASTGEYNKEKNEDIIYINKYMPLADADIAGRWEDANLIKEFSFLNEIETPHNMKITRQGKIYTKDYEKDGTQYQVNESKMHFKFKEYCAMFADEENSIHTSVQINFSKDELLPDCIEVPEKYMQKSIINNTEVRIYETEEIEDMSKIRGRAYLKCNEYNIKIEVYNITNEEFITLVRSTITNFEKVEEK